MVEKVALPLSMWKKNETTLPSHIVSPGVLRPNYKSKTKLLEDDRKYIYNLVVGKCFLKRVCVQRKSISHEGKYKIFEIKILNFCYQKTLLR